MIYGSYLLLPLKIYLPSLQFPDAAGYVGFANLPNQVHRKSVKKGFEFTLMVVGGWASLIFTYMVDLLCTGCHILLSCYL